ncbi:HSF_DOMAIN domain-containing protein [Caerostris extrusa]|uniref:HSF_DOMAIN domain-containing protein n=1 Tax=Caerostris extrusa TaxID=172846 RepID=A0AAV4UPC9_CAEEX|nr:HSF_DOMAIN domain-containing protein [Caerostris extrusa]
MSDWEQKKFPLFNMKFPEKLWFIVNDCETGAIGWGPSGETIHLEYEKFQEEYLDKNMGVFKTNNIASFVRQLNLYGFRKCNRYNEDKHEFKHPLFMKDRKDLIEYVRRKPGSLIKYLNPTIRTPRGSKMKNCTEVSQCKKKTLQFHALPIIEFYARSLYKGCKPEVLCNFPNHISGNTQKGWKQFKTRYSKIFIERTPLRCHQDSNMLNPMRHLWWNNIPAQPYPSNFYCDGSIVEQAWLPVNGSFCNSPTTIKQEPDELENDENCYFKDTNANENRQVTPKGSGNMFFLVVPGYPSPHSHNIYGSPGYYSGMLPMPGMAMGLNPENENSGMYSREMSFYESGNVSVCE